MAFLLKIGKDSAQKSLINLLCPYSIGFLCIQKSNRLLIDRKYTKIIFKNNMCDQMFIINID
mgnify:CR=1 FL=1